MNTSREPQFAFVRDRIVKVTDANIHISDLAVQRGYGVFDFFKIKGTHPFFLQKHLDRFFHSAEIMKLTVPLSRVSIVEIVRDLISRNELDESGIKIILTGGYSPDGYHIAPASLILTQHPLTLPSIEQTEKGISIITHPYSKEFPDAKTINYSMGIWLLDRIKASGAADVLYHHQDMISEFPRCNVFIVDDDGLIKTPSTNILKGITRQNILSLSPKKFKIVEADISLSELSGAREVFLTSTTKRVLPVVEIDHRKVGDGSPGGVSMAVLDCLMQLEWEDIR